MANTIKLKRGSGSDPGSSDLSVGELAIRTDTALLFTKNDGGSIVPIGISDGDKGDITVSSSGATFTIDNDAVTYAKIQNVSATNRILGRDSSGAGVIEEITPANLRTMLNVEDGATADQTKSDIDGLGIAASTAATLANARTIAGVSFDGSANISLNNNAITNGAGYITATLTQEQVEDFVGGMLTGNTETGITVTYQDSDGTIDFVVGTLNQDTTGNAATATALETARNIGGVSFDGTGNINLPGVNTSGNQNTSGTSGGFTAGSASNLNSGTLPDARFPSTLPAVSGANLTGISAGATGGGSDEIFYENGQNVTTDYTITNGKNAMSAGPITIDSGVTVTVGSGETLTIV